MGMSFGLIYTPYYYSLGNMFGAISTIAWIVIVVLNLFVFSRTRKFGRFRDFLLLTLLIVPFLQHLSEGGFTTGGGVIFAFIVAPLALIATDLRRATFWYLGIVFVFILAGFLDPFARTLNSSSDTEAISLFVLNFVSISLFIFVFMRYFVNQRDKALHLLMREQEKSETLLLNILPKQIADILKKEERVIADRYDNASIMFADLSGFTPMSAQMQPEEMIALLNKLYSHFDSLAEKYDVEKIRTIGDNYMVASGVPTTRTDHAQALAHMALDIILYCSTLPAQNETPIRFRIGINSGPLIAGVIGQKKFHYDVWGDTVNTASRMESHGVAGKIQMTAATRELLKDEFDCEKRGVLDIKGKGQMETWFLLSRK